MADHTAVAERDKQSNNREKTGKKPGLEFDAALDALLGQSSAEAAEIFIKESRGNRLWLAAHRGVAARAFRQRTVFELGEGYPGLVAERGEPILTLDLAHDARYKRNQVKKRGFCYYLCVPVCLDGNVAGSVHIASRHKPGSVADQLPLLTRVAAQIGSTLELSQLRARELVSVLPADPAQDPKKNLERKLSHALKAMMTLTGADGGIVFLRDRASGTLHPWWWEGAYKRSSGLLAQADPELTVSSCSVLECERCLVMPVEGEERSKPCQVAPSQLATLICLPLKAGDGVLGVVSIGYRYKQTLPGRLLGLLDPMVERMALEVVDAQASIQAEQRAATAGEKRLQGEVDAVVGRSIEPVLLRIKHARDGDVGTAGRLRKELDGVQALLRESSREIADALKTGAGRGEPVAETPLSRKAAEAPFLDLRCLGHFAIYLNGQRVLPERFKRRRALTLLKILLSNYGKPVHREVLIDLLWPDAESSAAATKLKVVVHYLRRALQTESSERRNGGFVIWTGDGYAFDVKSPHRLDAKDFVSLLEWGARLAERGDYQGALATYQAASDLYIGDYLEEERYSDWCSSERDYLRARFLSLLRRTAALLRQGDDVESAIACYRRLIHADGTLEDAHRDLMHLLWDAGRREEALKQYDICRDLLRQRTGLSPQPETEALYRQIVNAGER